MIRTFPEKDDFIDIHSHHWNNEPGIFRISSLSVPDFREIPVDRVCSIGLHPWHINLVGKDENIGKILDQAGRMKNILAFGEAGLDKDIETDMEIQKKIFSQHIEYAEKHKKPLIIHCVKAYDELLELRTEYRAEAPWIIHGFSSSGQMAEDLTSKGFFLSVGERLLRKKNKGKDVVQKIPLSFLFMETDEDDRTIEEIYEEVAEIKMISVNELKEYVFGNFLKSFESSHERLT